MEYYGEIDIEQLQTLKLLLLFSMRHPSMASKLVDISRLAYACCEHEDYLLLHTQHYILHDNPQFAHVIMQFPCQDYQPGWADNQKLYILNRERLSCSHAKLMWHQNQTSVGFV